jgi:HAD superfamily hydrolase (TIGR01484 family)
MFIGAFRRYRRKALFIFTAVNPHLPECDVGYEEQRLLAFQRLVAERVPEISMIMNQNDYLEAIPAGVSKGEALVRLGKLQGIPPSQIVAFGDSVNDRELLALAGIGIAMADAPGELKEAADRTAANMAAGLKELLD